MSMMSADSPAVTKPDAGRPAAGDWFGGVQRLRRACPPVLPDGYSGATIRFPHACNAIAPCSGQGDLRDEYRLAADRLLRDVNTRRVLVTGGTGFIGRALCGHLLDAGWRLTVLSRQPGDRVRQLCGASADVISSLTQLTSIAPLDAVINLAGEGIADGRWTAARKQVLRDSRIALTQTLCRELTRLSHKPAVVISGSAVGYYGDGGDAELTEASPAGCDFAATLCSDWEQAVRPLEGLGIRVCRLRTGLVLHPDGGALQRLLFPAKLGLGAVIGTGRQFMAWITREDLCRLMLFLLERDAAQGAFNGVAPQPVTNRDFTVMLARALHRPAFLSVPAPLLKLGLGESASLLLASQRVVPRRAPALGFRFHHATLESALAGFFS